MTDKEAIIALLRACVQMPPERCQNTLAEALRQMDAAKAKEAIAQAQP